MKFRLALLLVIPAIQCIQLLPSPLQEIGPALSALLNSTTTTTYVVVGNNGTILRSTDGSTWTTHSLPGSATNNLRAVVHSGTNFVAVGSGNTGSASSVAYYSSDGTTWTASTGASCAGGTGDGVLTHVTVGGTRVVAVGQVAAGTATCAVYSDDHGVTWTASTTAGNSRYSGIVYTGTTFFSLDGSARPQRSTDGSTFTNFGSGISLTTKGTTLAAVAVDGKPVVAGTYNAANVGACWSTDDGTSWPAGNCADVFADNGAQNVPLAMAASATRIVAVGQVSATQCRLDFTDNLTTPTFQTGDTFFPSGVCSSIQLNGITHTGTEFIAVGASGKILRSATGAVNDWTSQIQGSADLFGVTTKTSR